MARLNLRDWFPGKEKFNSWILLGVFSLLNVSIFLVAELILQSSGRFENPAVQNAADGQRYWAVAKQLVEARQFSTSSETYTPLRKSGPLTGTFFSAAIYVFGADWGSRIIIFLQCVLLFAMGVLSRELAIPFSANKNVVQSLIIFNPNLLGQAHSTQSDLLFAFLATIFLVVSSRVNRGFNRPRVNTPIFLQRINRKLAEPSLL